MRLLLQNAVFPANLLPLDSSPDTEIDCEGGRGWYDECVKVGRRRGWEDDLLLDRPSWRSRQRGLVG